jgi:hypothetical protein
MNTGRSGTTLLTQIMQIKEATLAYSEPDCISTLAGLIDRQVWPEELQEKLIDASLIALTKNVKCVASADQQRLSIVIKTRCFSSNDIVRLMCKSCNPNIKHIFMYRKRPRSGVTSMYRAFLSRMIVERIFS